MRKLHPSDLTSGLTRALFAGEVVQVESNSGEYLGMYSWNETLRRWALAGVGEMLSLDTDAILGTVRGFRDGAQAKTNDNNFWKWSESSTSAVAAADSSGNGVLAPDVGIAGRWLQQLPTGAGGTGTGDWTGAASANTVVKLRGKDLDSSTVGAPGDLTVLQYETGTSKHYSRRVNRSRQVFWGDPKWNMPTGTSDCTAAIQNIITSSGPSVEHIPDARTYYMSGPVYIDNQAASPTYNGPIYDIAIRGFNPVEQMATPVNKTTFLYSGSNTVNGCLFWMATRGVVFDGLVFKLPNDTSHPIYCLLYMGQTTVGAALVSQMSIKNCTFDPGTNAMKYGIAQATLTAATQNMEDTYIESSQFYGGTQTNLDAFFILGTGQSYNITFNDVNFSMARPANNTYGAGIRVSTAGNGIKWRDGNATGLTYFIYGDQPVQAAVDGLTSETLKCLYAGPSGTSAHDDVLIMNGRIATDAIGYTGNHPTVPMAAATKRYIDTARTGCVTLLNNKFNNGAYDANFKIYSARGSFVLQGNAFPNLDPITMNASDTFVLGGHMVSPTNTGIDSGGTVSSLTNDMFRSRNNSFLVTFTETETTKVVTLTNQEAHAHYQVTCTPESTTGTPDPGGEQAFVDPTYTMTTTQFRLYIGAQSGAAASGKSRTFRVRITQ